MTKMNKLLAALAIASASSLSVSCDVLECGPGTTEKNGECVPVDGEVPENIFCDVGTHYDGALQACVPDTNPTICGDNTTEEIDPVTGLITCVGSGGGNSCEKPCPQPDAGKNTVCGRLVDAETGEFITMTWDTDGTDCQDIPENERLGPCLMKVEFYDALGFAQNPTGTDPLLPDDLVINNCGWFKGTNIPTPALGFLAVSADDEDSVAVGDDQWVLTGVVFPVAPGDRRPEQVTYVVSNDTDETWTETAGGPFGTTTFSEKGVFFPIYLLDGDPVEGVKVTRDPAGVVANDDYYFSDTNPHVRRTVDATQDATGPNGAALMVNSPLVDHGGTGGDLPTGCVWPPDLAKSIPGVVFANERWAVDDQGDDCVVP